MSFRRLHSWCLAAWIAVLCCCSPAVLWAQSRGTGLIQRGEAPDLLILYTGDVIGHLGPCG